MGLAFRGAPGEEESRSALKSNQSETARSALSKVCHSERSEESALPRVETELQILRFAQDDTDFHLHEWAAGPWALGMTREAVFPQPVMP